MIRERAYPVEPWHVRETRLDMDVLAQSESVFALSNGHVGLRGNLDEGEPHGLPGTYLNSFYELRPLPYAEAGFGFPESGQTIVNVTNGKLIRLLVDDEPLDVRYGEVLAHERVLDLRSGTLHRSLHWRSPAGREVRVNSTRLVSFRQRSVAAIRYEVAVADDKPLRLIVQSELVANETLPPQSRDPRVAAVLESPLEAEEELTTPGGGLLIHRTKVSGLRVAAAMEHEVESPARTTIDSEGYEDWVRTTVACVLEPGEKLCVMKYLTYGWSSQRSLPALRDQVGAALAAARLDGWDGLVREQREYLDEFWDAADVRGRGRPGGAAGGPVRAVPRAPGRRPRGAAADLRQGSHRPRVRRARLLGHRDVRAAGADVHPSGGGTRRALLAACDAAEGPRAGPDAEPGRRGLPVAHHRGAGVVGLLAGGHRRRSTSPRTSPTRCGATCWSPGTVSWNARSG